MVKSVMLNDDVHLNLQGIQSELERRNFKKSLGQIVSILIDRDIDTVATEVLRINLDNYEK